MSTTTRRSRNDELTARIGVYRLLSRLWIREVDDEFLQQLHSSDLRDPLREVDIDPPAASPATIETLAVDYCQLFLGPSQHLPPFQSVWQSGQFQGHATILMRRYLEVVGYTLDEKIGELYLDHLGLQFDVMAHILAVRNRADQEEAVREIEIEFFAAHLDWPMTLLNAAHQKAETRFYQSVIDLTRRFLESESAQIRTQSLGTSHENV